MSKISENDKYIQELREELERITADPELREKYEYREKELRDILSMVKAGKIEIVLNMHKKNMDIETISEIVNISKEEVEKIIVENSSC